jgi:hypothetical protein
MKAKVALRIACILILIHLLGHALGHSTWDSPEDSGMQSVVAAMKSHSAEFMGATRSMADYFTGYSSIMFFLYAMSISVLWTCSSVGETNRIFARKILSPIALAYVAFGVIEFTYFFAFAGAMSLGAGLLILYAVYLFSKVPATS